MNECSSAWSHAHSYAVYRTVTITMTTAMIMTIALMWSCRVVKTVIIAVVVMMMMKM